MYQLTVELHLSEPVGIQVVHIIGVCSFLPTIYQIFRLYNRNQRARVYFSV